MAVEVITLNDPKTTDTAVAELRRDCAAALENLPLKFMAVPPVLVKLALDRLDELQKQVDGMREAEAASERLGTIDLTPVGCQTPEGAQRVEEAIDNFEDVTAAVANIAQEFLAAFDAGGAGLAHEDGGAELSELREACRKRVRVQEEMLRAIAGRPNLAETERA